MKRIYTLFVALLVAQLSFGQAVYLDQFDSDDLSFYGTADNYAYAIADSELTITGSGTNPYEAFTYTLHNTDDGMPMTIDMTGNNKVYIKMKAGNVGTQLRMDVIDVNGYVTSIDAVTKTMTSDYNVYEFDFTAYQDGGYGGTPCDAASAPCAVDGTQITTLLFYADPALGGFNGSIVLDYIAFGEEPDGGNTDTVFDDHMELDSVINSWDNPHAGYNLELTGESTIKITGDGSLGQYDAFAYLFRNYTTYEQIDVDFTGNNKMYVKMKSTVPNTAVRIDLQDIDTYLTTQGSITKIIGTDWQVVEFNYSGVYNDLGYGGSPCTSDTAPCPVDGTRIANLVFFIEPGVGEFLGEVEIDYISVGSSLEPPGAEPVKLYEDHFGNETLDWTEEVGGFGMSEVGSEWIWEGDGTAGPYTAISHTLHDKILGEAIVLDMTDAANKVFVRVRTDGADFPLRLDIIDEDGYHTSQSSLTKTVTGDYTILEYDFTGNAFDGGFGGTACDAGPCPVDLTRITQVLLYPNPVEGGYAGTVYLDYISIGQPAGEDLGVTGVLNYQDQMDDNTALFTADMSGLTSVFANDEWTITGDGTAGAYAPVTYALHNDLGELVIADAVSGGDKIYVRAKSSVDGTELRIDVQDNLDYVSNASAQAKNLTTEYDVYEYVYTGAYLDGGYGGSPCTADTAPCAVDGQRIANMQFFINAADGGFEGDVTIDWISYSSPITGVNDITRLGELMAFPNPAQSAINVQFETLQSANVTVNVFNTIGAKVAVNQLGMIPSGTSSERIDLNNLTPGIYFITVDMDGANVGTLKFIKQ